VRTGALLCAALLCAALLATAACRDGTRREVPTKEPIVNADPSNPCAAALRAFSAGELATWTGLPAGCTDLDLGAVFGGGGLAAADGLLSADQTKFREYPSGDPQQPLIAWFDAADTVILLHRIAPPIGDVAALLAALGPPEHKLEPGVGHHAAAHQWIYARRGLTLWVRERRNDIARVAVYPPTTAAEYEHRLGGHDKTRYLPR
jgi:hypothetical protein